MQLKALWHTFKHSGILLKRPNALIRAFIGILKSIIMMKDQLRVVEFVINSECDSKCIMCYATKYVDPTDTPLTAEEIGNIWRECEKLGAIVAIVEGGEPTLRKDFDDVIKALRPFRNIVVVVSNSLGLTKKKLMHYKKIGISVMHLSLDGISPEENDLVRGVEGHFNKVMKAVRWCKELGIDVYLSSVLSHSSKERFERILKLAKKMNIGVSGALMVSEGRSTDLKERLTEGDRKWLMKIVAKYRHVIRFDWNTNFSGTYACPAGREKISISLYGQVMACVCNHLSFGNLRNECLKDVWGRMKKFSYFRKKNPKCLIGFDTKYRRRYFDTVDEKKFLPISIFNHPVYPARINKKGLIEE